MLSLFAIFLAQAPTRLPDTVVIETRQAAPLADASPSVSRLDVTAATESGQTTLAGLLGGAPGVYATEQSGEGSVGSLFLRGTNSTQTAVLLDGRRLPQGFSNSYEIGRYRIFGLSSVEILRGPSSSLYGANALGGVIDLRQQSPLSAKAGSTLVAEGGSYGRGSLGFAFLSNNAVGTQAATNGASVSLSASHDDGWRPNGDRDALSAYLKQEWRLSPNLVFDLVGSADHGKAGLPGQDIGGAGSLTDWERDSGWLLSPGLRFHDADTEATVFWSRAGSAISSVTAPYANRYLLDRDEVTAFVDRKVRPDLTLGLGVSYERSSFEQFDVVANSLTWADTHESLGIWTRADWQVTAADRVRASVRDDRFTDFAGKTTGEVSYSHRFTKELLAHAKIGTAYRAPAANDLAYGTHLGLPLRPESNTGNEIGLRHEDAVPGALSWTLVAFRNELTDLIDYNPSSYQTYNISKARTQGVEAGIETRPAKGLRLFGATTWLDSEIRSTDYYLGTGLTGDKLLRRPSLTLTVGLEVIPNDDWTFGVSAAHLRGREDFDWNSYARVSLPNATFVRVWVRRTLSDNTEISLRIENLFGEDAPPAAFGFGAQPRSAYVGLTRRF
ncbi:MAG: TonB-dependent receptor [Verrucomicrobia bacterium]|nr:TonB-dependent receptor [Verrucomicrobiota bacterium]